MQLTLYFRGDLRSSAGRLDKHQIRQLFHKQLSAAWNEVPLRHFRHLLNPQSPHSLSVLRPFGAYTFAPLVTEKGGTVAELHLVILRPEPPGSIITQGGDIDNRVKILLDVLKMPNHPNTLPSDASPQPDENPFFCLLEDDNLVTGLSVTTHRLLEAVRNPSEVVILVQVETKQLAPFVDIIGL